MALVAVCSNRFTLSPILARAWVAGNVKVRTVFPSPTVVTRAPEDEYQIKEMDTRQGRKGREQVIRIQVANEATFDCVPF